MMDGLSLTFRMLCKKHDQMRTEMIYVRSNFQLRRAKFVVFAYN